MPSRRTALFACLLAILAAAPPAPAKDSATDLERKIEELMLPLNGFFDPAKYTVAAGDHAARVGIEAPAIEWDEGERLKLEDGSPSDLVVYRLQISGQGPFVPLYQFLESFWLTSGVKLEKMKLEAVAGNQVSYQLTYAAVHVDVQPADSKKSAAAAQNERRRLTVKLLEQVGQDSQSRSLLDSVASLTAALDSSVYGAGETRPVGLARLELDPAGTAKLEGAALGPSARKSFETAIAAAGFASFEVDFRPPSGLCVPFTATVKPGQAPEDEYQLGGPNGLFDAGIPDLCGGRGGAEPKKIAIAGKAGEKGIDLRLVDVDWMDALEVIFALLEEPFLASPEIPAFRLSFDVKGASRDELLAALAKAGLEVGPGTPHWVVAAGSPQPQLSAGSGFQGEVTTFSLRRGRLEEMLCAIGVAAGEKEVWAAGPIEGEVRIVADLPWDQALAAVLAPRGLVHRVEGERLLIGPGPAAKLAGREGLVQLCVGGGEEGESRPFAGSRLAEMDFDEYELTPQDVRLVGIGRKGELWLGAAYGPNRKRIYLLPNFGTFAGGSVSVGPAGVTIDQADGEKAPLQLP